MEARTSDLLHRVASVIGGPHVGPAWGLTKVLFGLQGSPEQLQGSGKEGMAFTSSTVAKSMEVFRPLSSVRICLLR